MTANKIAIGIVSVIGAALATSSLTALASSHREAPGITRTPKIDNTDLYAFRSYEPGREEFVTVIANFQPGEAPGAGPNYYTMDPNARYEIHFDSNGDGVEDYTYRFKFNNQVSNGGKGIQLAVGGKTVSIPLRAAGPVNVYADENDGEKYSISLVTGNSSTGTEQPITMNGFTSVVKPIDNIGTKTIPDYPTYAKKFVYTAVIPGCQRAGRIFVGQRAEAFAVNLGHIFDLVHLVPIEGDSRPGAGDHGGFPGGVTQSRGNDDLVGKANVTSIAIEVPINCVVGSGNRTIGVWSTTSLPQTATGSATPTYDAVNTYSGDYVQRSRLGMPLVNELVIGLPDKDKFNASQPKDDGQFADYVTNPTIPAILNLLFRSAVNSTLGTNIANLAPTNLPRNDLVAAYLTGFPGLNQQSTVTASEMIRLNTIIGPTPRATQNNLGVVGGDSAGFPNGRRPGDDAVDITLRVAMGRLCYPVSVRGAPAANLGLCQPSDASVGNVNFTDGAPISARDLKNEFPYLNDPIPGAASASQ